MLIQIGKHRPARRRFTTAHGSVHSDRIERWLGAAACEQLSRSMRGWYGTPIAVARVPGEIYVDKQGDFVGRFDDGGFACLGDWLEDRARVERIEDRVRFARRVRQFGGFSTVDEVRGWGGQQRAAVAKTIGSATASIWGSGWRQNAVPVAGAAAAAAPGGTVPTNATTGAIPFNNPTTGTAHLLGAEITTIGGLITALLYDRIFAVAKTMNSTATEAVTGVPTRYQSTTQGAADSAENNFLFMEVGTALAATAHNWTTCLYTDQSNNAGATLPSVTGNSSAVVNRLDMPGFQWFATLASGDTGIKALTQMQCSAAVATGAVDFVIGHPIGWFVSDFVGVGKVQRDEKINSAVNMARIFSDACLALLGHSSTASISMNGQIVVGAR